MRLLLCKRDQLNQKNKIVSGVFGGIAEYFNFDPVWVKIISAALILFTGIFLGVILYVIAALVMPEPSETAPTVEKHEADYQTGRPNSIEGEFSKKNDEDDTSSDSTEK